MFQFGIGGLFVNPVGGNEEVPNPTPYELLTVQDVSVDISQELKELVGQNKLPDDIAPGQMKITGKFTIGRIDINIFNNILFADTALAGIKQIQKDEAAIVGATPYTAVVANSVDFITDLGVRYASNGAALTRTTGTVNEGMYSVSNGTYTFNALDTTVPVLISYVWTNTPVGKTVQLNQQLMGYGPVFELWLSEPYQSVAGSPSGIHLYCCRLSKLGQALKNTDYVKPEMDFSAFANASGNVGELFQTAA
jgi:hypothetical protein